jgi:NAD(P)-dependent dehydrogenase (short-subunit alcohol dehydrogenase family)
MTAIDRSVAVITGAGSGIGRATAVALAQRGAVVCVSDIDGQRAKAVATEITRLGGRAVGTRCDVTSDDDVAALSATARSSFGRVDIVMSNVGVIAKGLPLEIPMDAWSSIIDVNLLGTVRVLHAFLPALLERAPATSSRPGRPPACSRMPTTGCRTRPRRPA